MKRYKYILFAILLTAIIAVSCEQPDGRDQLDAGDNYTLTTQQQVDAFDVESNIHTLIVEGEDIKDLSQFNFLNAKELYIRNTSVEELEMSKLSAVSIKLGIEANAKMTAISDISNLRFVTGDIVISDNPLLEDISGMLGLKLFNGNISIINNKSLGEDKPNRDKTYGLNVVKYLIDNSVIKGEVKLENNHPLAATDPSKIGQMQNGSVLSYTIASLNAAQNFTPEKDTVMNLTIKGADITDDVIKLVAKKIVAVRGKLLIENTAITTTQGFIDAANCEDTIHLKNNLSLTNPNGFTGYTHIGGSLIIEGCPITFWQADALTNIQRVDGSVQIYGEFTTQAMLRNLKYVGGDFDIRNGGTVQGYQLWDFVGMDLTYIGGSLIIKNNSYFYTFAGLLNLTNIGKNIDISGNGSAIGGQMDNNAGWKIVKGYRDNGIVKGTISVKDLSGNDVNLDNY